MLEARWEEALFSRSVGYLPIGPRHVRRIRRLAATLLAQVPEGVLLDAGCGWGSLSAALAGERRSVVAFDPDPDRLATARRLMVEAGATERVDLMRAHAEAIPLPGDSCAGIAAGEVLEHIADEAAAVRELARVMQPGGALVVTVPAGSDRYGVADSAVGHFRRYDRDDLVRLLMSGGFRVDSIHGWGGEYSAGHARRERLLHGCGSSAIRDAFGRPLSRLGLHRAAVALLLRLRSTAADSGSDSPATWMAVAVLDRAP